MASNAKLLNPASELDGITDRDLQRLIDAFVAGVRASGERGLTGVLSGTPARGDRLWEIQLDGSQPRPTTPDFRVLATPETMRQLVSGAISPIDAVRDGRVRVAAAIAPVAARRLFAQ